jgi:hypothetical protein
MVWAAESRRRWRSFSSAFQAIPDEVGVALVAVRGGSG